MYKYYFAIATRNFLINEEPIEEILRERTLYYNSMKKSIDFWFVMEPEFVNYASINNFKCNTSKSYAAIVSSNPKFIHWLKLRIGFVATGFFISQSLFMTSK
uniref:Ycf54 n=1 Tax=Ptilothamnion sphaericum TaxID=1498216 RepID=A0A4D6X0L1_9FLOR|nr:hypothetical protein [Ptilothamnion sphaericum]QCI08348.1 hypothetical protein [Ptilothamnion sphaericum]